MGEGPGLISGGTDRHLRIVFDSNVVISALVFAGRLAWLRRSWSSGETIPLVCRGTAAELLRVLAYPKFRLDRADQALLLEDYLPFGEVITIPDPPPSLPVPCRDPDDAIFIQLAIAGGADFLVSGDADLTSLRDSSPVPVITAAELKSVLESRTTS